MNNSPNAKQTNISLENSGINLADSDNNTVELGTTKEETTVNNQKISLSLGGLAAIVVASVAAGGGSVFLIDNAVIGTDNQVKQLEEQLEQSKQNNINLQEQIQQLQNTPPDLVNKPNMNDESASTGCVVTITNSLVAIQREPSILSPEIIKVPSGDYEVFNYAGSATWLQIKVEIE